MKRLIILTILVISIGCSLFRSSYKTAVIQQTKTIESIRAIGTALEAYKLVTEQYPIGKSGHLEEIEDILVPRYLSELDSYRKDGWGNEIEYYCMQEEGPYYIISLGADKERDVGLYRTNRLPSGVGFEVFTDIKNDLIFSNGLFVRYPEGLQVARKGG